MLKLGRLAPLTGHLLLTLRRRMYAVHGWHKLRHALLKPGLDGDDVLPVLAEWGALRRVKRFSELGMLDKTELLQWDPLLVLLEAMHAVVRWWGER